jgi:hypothetical protein
MLQHKLASVGRRVWRLICAKEQCMVRKSMSIPKEMCFGEATVMLFGRHNNYFVVFLKKIVIITRFANSEELS